MKHEYVGDIGDFANNALLRYLCGLTGLELDNPLRLGVIWYLNQPKTTNYLFQNGYDGLLNCDLALGNTLKVLVCQRLHVSTSNSYRSLLPKDTEHYDTPLPKPTSKEARRRWFDGALEEVKNTSVVFVNQDNGIKLEQSTTSVEHISIGEIRSLFKARKSLVIYHHLGERKGKAKERIKSIAKQLSEELDSKPRIWALWWHREQARVYFIVVHPIHSTVLNQRLRSFVDDRIWFETQPGFDSPHFTNVQLNQEG